MVMVMKSRKAFTLVELMIAAAVLTLIALGGISYVYHSKGLIAMNKLKRNALQVAETRLEKIRTADFLDIKPTEDSYKKAYLLLDNNIWKVSSVDSQDVVVLNERDYPVKTTVVFQDIDSSDGVDSYDYLDIAVSVKWNQNIDNEIILETFVFPK